MGSRTIMRKSEAGRLSTWRRRFECQLVRATLFLPPNYSVPSFSRLPFGKDAVDRLKEGIAAHGDCDKLADRAFLATAHDRLGQTEDAHRWLEVQRASDRNFGLARGAERCIATPSVSRWSDEAHAPNPSAAKWFGSPRNSWARRIYVPRGRKLALGSHSGMRGSLRVAIRWG
jgi:hypothetical protein